MLVFISNKRRRR